MRLRTSAIRAMASGVVSVSSSRLKSCLDQAVDGGCSCVARGQAQYGNHAETGEAVGDRCSAHGRAPRVVGG